MKQQSFNLGEKTAYVSARFGLPLLGRLPMPVLYAITKVVGALAYRYLHRDRNRALLNLRLAYADRLSARKMQLITKGMFLHLAKISAECLALYTNPSQKLWDRMHVDKPQIISDGLSKGHGLVIFTAHCGNWEYLAAKLYSIGFTGLVLSRKIRSSAFQELVKSWREKIGILECYSDVSLKPLIGCLRRNVCIGVLNDQDVDRAQGIFVDFFGIPAFTPRFVSEISFKMHTPMAPCLAVRRKNNTHVIKIFTVIEPREGEQREHYVLRSQQEYAAALEKQIRHHPSQWVWFHKRWKTRPEPASQRT